MIQKIQAFEIPNKGTATEVKVEVQERFTTQEKAIIYYDLRDPNGTTQALSLSTQEYVTLPYSILSYQKIIATGEDLNGILADSKFALNIFSRERSDITIIKGIKLALSTKEPNDSCVLYQENTVQTFYLDTEGLEFATILSETEDMETLIGEECYVSDGKIIRYWNTKGFDEKFIQYCKK